MPRPFRALFPGGEERGGLGRQVTDAQSASSLSLPEGEAEEGRACPSRARASPCSGDRVLTTSCEEGPCDLPSGHPVPPSHPQCLSPTARTVLPASGLPRAVLVFPLHLSNSYSSRIPSATAPRPVPRPRIQGSLLGPALRPPMGSVPLQVSHGHSCA